MVVGSATEPNKTGESEVVQAASQLVASGPPEGPCMGSRPCRPKPTRPVPDEPDIV